MFPNGSGTLGGSKPGVEHKITDKRSYLPKASNKATCLDGAHATTATLLAKYSKASKNHKSQSEMESLVYQAPK